MFTALRLYTLYVARIPPELMFKCYFSVMTGILWLALNLLSEFTFLSFAVKNCFYKVVVVFFYDCTSLFSPKCLIAEIDFIRVCTLWINYIFTLPFIISVFGQNLSSQHSSSSLFRNFVALPSNLLNLKS